MAYDIGLLAQIEQWLESGVIPRLRYVKFTAPTRRADLGVGNKVYDGDYLKVAPGVPALERGRIRHYTLA
jgi:hypothetical protein